jgi:tRNA synthetases class I (W and Y)
VSQTGPITPRVLTGDRPTGPLHLGHHFGTLQNRVRLQEQGVELFVLVADYQTITDRDAPEGLPTDVDGLVADYLAVGIDPDRATIFAHSQVGALNQLIVPFLSLVSVAEVGRNPTAREEMSATGGAAMSALMFTYPVHQAADILFCRATLVPRRPRSAPACRARPAHRPAVQRPLRRRSAALPRARGAARLGPAAPRRGRRQDEQEPPKRHRHRRERGRDGPADPGRQNRFGARDHL